MAPIVCAPTYSKIKEYILEHTGLKVSSAYIAQIKQKCSLDAGEYCNKPKSENSATAYVLPKRSRSSWMLSGISG